MMTTKVCRLSSAVDEASIRQGVYCDVCGYPFDGGDRVCVDYTADGQEIIGIYCSNTCKRKDQE